MKIDRLIGIIMTLINNEKLTIDSLADKFEVSRRTISRDIEDICKAGIPIVTEQGFKGGISIAEGYKIDKTLLTKEEMQSLFIGLRGLDSVSAAPRSRTIEDKFQLRNKGVFSTHDHILIDLASHYKGSLTQKFELLKDAIEKHNIVSFDYYYLKGQSKREVEPYLLVFKWSSWYLYGYCSLRQDFRMFKLNRLWDLHIIEKTFITREITEEQTDFDSCWSQEIKLVAYFDDNVKYRLIDEYGVDSYTMEEDGRLYMELWFTHYDNLREWIFSFGDKVEVIEPLKLREDIKKHAENILKLYKGI